MLGDAIDPRRETTALLCHSWHFEGAATIVDRPVGLGLVCKPDLGERECAART
jgi:hypothetical protein